MVTRGGRGRRGLRRRAAAGSGVKKQRAKRAERLQEELPGLVLDAGALQALERRPIRLLVDLQRAHALGLPIRIPAGALAQSWRGGRLSLTHARKSPEPLAAGCSRRTAEAGSHPALAQASCCEATHKILGRDSGHTRLGGSTGRGPGPEPCSLHRSTGR